MNLPSSSPSRRLWVGRFESYNLLLWKEEGCTWVFAGSEPTTAGVWSIATEQDFFGFSGRSARGAVSAFLVAIVLLTLVVYVPRLLFNIAAISPTKTVCTCATSGGG